MPIRILIVTDQTDKWECNLSVVLNLENTKKRRTKSFVTYENPMFDINVAPPETFRGRRYDNIVIDCKVSDEYVEEVLRPMLYHAGAIQYVGLGNIECAPEGCIDAKAFEREYTAVFD